MPDVLTKASEPRAATLLETVAEDEEEARFESTTVTVAPAATYKAPPSRLDEFTEKLQMTRDTADEVMYIPPPCT